MTAVNFSTVTYSISGTISGAGGNAATVNLTGASTATATTDASGNYTFSGLVNGSYTVTPSKSGFTFTPPSQRHCKQRQRAGVNFSSAALPTFSISGTISGAGGNAATVTLSGTSSATVTASALGNYTFSNLVNGSYTVTPSKSGFIFTPANKAVTVSGANVTGGELHLHGAVSDRQDSFRRRFPHCLEHHFAGLEHHEGERTAAGLGLHQWIELGCYRNRRDAVEA